MAATRQALLIAILLAATGSLAAQAEQPRRPMDTNQRRICRTSVEIGTRLGRVRRCRTQTEWIQADLESRQVIDRMQRFLGPCSPWSRC